jgi:NSS family neurotransmitter:Na+ symporter
MGLGSAISLEFLTNQDFVWAFALLISGFLFFLMVLKYGVSRYRRDAFNDYSDKDWYLPKAWEFLIL